MTAGVIILGKVGKNMMTPGMTEMMPAKHATKVVGLLQHPQGRRPGRPPSICDSTVSDRPLSTSGLWTMHFKYIYIYIYIYRIIVNTLYMKITFDDTVDVAVPDL